MPKTHINLLAALFCLIVFASCKKEAVAPAKVESEWTIYNSENSKLPNNQVQAITVDKNNNKWFGTAEGLARLSGSDWTVYTTSNSGLPSLYITALTNDASGNLWIGTNKGLVKFNGTNWMLYNSRNSLLSNEEVIRLLYDKNKSELWIGTAAGLVKYDGTHWNRYDENNSGLIEGSIRSLALDKNGILWVGTFDTFRFFGHIWKFNGAEWSSTRLDRQGLPSSFPEGMAVDEQNVLWIGLKGTMGAILVKIESDKWEVFNSSTFSGLHGGVSSVIVEGNTKWLSTGFGLVAYDGTNWKSINISNSKIPENTLFTTAIDRDGNKWIGTYTGGVAFYKQH